MDLYTILVDFGALGLALLALFMPAVKKFVARWRRSLRLAPYQRIEIGFSDHGPTISLFGTFHALHAPFFITDLSLSVKRLRDQTTHAFGWRLFRPFNLELSNFEPAMAFYVPENGEVPKGIMFADGETQNAFAAEVIAAREDFSRHLASLDILVDSLPVDQLIKLGDEFSQNEGAVANAAAYSRADREFYWTPDEYLLELLVRTDSGQDQTFRWNFSISDEDSEKLRLNVIGLLRTARFVPGANYSFAQAELHDASA